MIDLHGSVLLSQLIKPSSPIHPAATLVHGITDADVIAAPALAEVAPQLLEVTAGHELLAYNAPYDHSAHRGLARRGVRPPLIWPTVGAGPASCAHALLRRPGQDR